MASKATQVLLAQKYSDKIDPTGWWISEKLDGVRAYWTGSEFYSRQGNLFHAPDFFKKDLPKQPLDGELWCGRGLFQKTLSIVKKTKNLDLHNKDWQWVTYLVFDAPSVKKPYEERVKYLKSVIKSEKQSTYAAVVGVLKCKDRDHLNGLLKQVLAKGGEGLMLRQPGSLYENRRSHTLLKVKTFHDEEAKITGSEKGTGRCSNMMGKLHCVLPNGMTFKVGTGFSDAQRKNPPKIGSIITFKYQELSNSGTPRFPVFLRARPELTWDDVCKNAKTKTPFSQIKKIIPALKKQHSILFSTVPSRDQGSGLKIVTDDDAASDDEFDASGKKKVACRYGATCYQNNPKHHAQFSHPKPKKAKVESKDDAADDSDSGSAGAASSSKKPAKKGKAAAAADNDDDAGGSGESKKTPCMWGAKCYRKAKEHLEKYSHPTPAEAAKEEEAEEDEPRGESDDENGDAMGDGESKGESKGDSKRGQQSKAAKQAKRSKETAEVSSEWGFGVDSDDDSDADGGGDDEEVTVKMSKKDWEAVQGNLAFMKNFNPKITLETGGGGGKGAGAAGKGKAAAKGGAGAGAGAGSGSGTAADADTQPVDAPEPVASGGRSASGGRKRKPSTGSIDDRPLKEPKLMEKQKSGLGLG